MADIGVYIITIMAEIPIQTVPGSGPNINDSFSFQVSVVDPCTTTSLSFDPVVANMEAFVNLGAQMQVVVAKDTSSTAYGNGDGFTLCGPRSYSIVPANLSFLTLEGNTLKLESADVNDHTASPITITLSATLDNYS